MALPSTAGRFLAWTAGVTSAGIAACIALVVVIDPYRLYGLIERPGMNVVKIQPTRYQNQIKLSAATATRAQRLIVGNSRAEIGLDPADSALGRPAMPTYNLALAGTRLQLANGQLAALARRGLRPRHLIVGAEFLDFPLDPGLPQVPVPDAIETTQTMLAWQFDALFSMESVTDAFHTVTQQTSPFAKTMTAQGYNPLNEYKQLARDEGYYALFQQRAVEYAKRFRSLPRGLTVGDTGSSNDFAQLASIVDSGARQGARVDVIIYPYHVQLMALYEAAGMDVLFDAWKSMVAQRLETLRTRYPATQINLWDFSGFGIYQCEPIPAKGDRSRVTEWYWEAGHFKNTLGHQMLDRVMSGAPDARDAGFGFRLTSANVAANRARIVAERSMCLARHPELFANSTALYNATAPQQTKLP
jgi:hypothetical protein